MKKLIAVLLCMLVSSVYAGTKKIVLTADNSLNMNQTFYSDVTAQLSTKALEMDAKLPSGDPIYLIIDSGGGSIEAGIGLINVLSKLNRPVHTVTLFAASMGFQTVQGLGKRYIVSNGTLMSHKARGGFYGEFPGQLDNRYGYYLKRVFDLDKIAAKRANMSLKKYHRMIENEYWCQGQQCVDNGFADAVVELSCDDSLKGTTQREIAKQYAMGQGGIIKLALFETYALCPAVTGALDWYITINDTKAEQSYTNVENLDELKVMLKKKIDAMSKTREVIKY